MKTIFFAFVFCIVYCISCLANEASESVEKSETSASEIHSGMEQIIETFSEKVIDFSGKKIKVIILNEQFRKVRVEVIEKMDDISLNSTLYPIFHKADLITKIDNVAYYLLRK